MILPSIMQGNENGMLLDKTLLSSNLVLQHFSSLLADSTTDEKSNNIQNGIEKINLNTCNNLSQNETSDTTTWIDLFHGNQSNQECTQKIKENINKHLIESPLTTW